MYGLCSTPGLVVATGADNYFVQDLELEDIAGANHVFLADLNEGEGFTNGCYTGPPPSVIAVMSRFTD